MGLSSSAVKANFLAVIVRTVVIDIVYSLDPIITAVGMVDDVGVFVMIAAVVVSVALMMPFAGAIGSFVPKHPTIKMLALSFLVVVGVVLIADGFGRHMPKGYVCFAMAFSVAVEILSMRRRGTKTAHLSAPQVHEQEPPKRP